MGIVIGVVCGWCGGCARRSSTRAVPAGARGGAAGAVWL